MVLGHVCYRTAPGSLPTPKYTIPYAPELGLAGAPTQDHSRKGHTYRLQVWCEGPIDPESGMVLDFQDIKDVVKTRVLDVVDHTLLNDRIENPTAERIAAWIWDQLADTDLPLKEIRLYETPTCFVVHRPAETPAPDIRS